VEGNSGRLGHAKVIVACNHQAKPISNPKTVQPADLKAKANCRQEGLPPLS
jgi:hypothetical protein